MDVARALSQVQRIHQHLAKGEVYRGYKPLPVALTGVVGLAAAWLQPAFHGDPGAFTLYWAAVAGLCLGIGGAPIARAWVQNPEGYERRRAWKAVAQFLPCLVAGAVVTAAVVSQAPAWAPLLPGLWALLFGLGVFSSRPYLPPDALWIGVYFMMAGAALLWTWESAAQLAGWRVGATFGLGQLASGLIIYREQRAQERV